MAINFLMIGADSYYLDRSSFLESLRTVLIPLLPSELAAALLAVGVAFIYVQIGLAGVALFGIVLSPSSTCSAPCCSPRSGPGSSRCAASSWPASRSEC